MQLSLLPLLTVRTSLFGARHQLTRLTQQPSNAPLPFPAYPHLTVLITPPCRIHAGPEAAAYDWERVPIAASALASLERIRLDASEQHNEQHGADAASPAPQAHSAGGLHHHASSLDTRTLEQASCSPSHCSPARAEGPVSASVRAAAVLRQATSICYCSTPPWLRLASCILL